MIYIIISIAFVLPVGTTGSSGVIIAVAFLMPISFAGISACVHFRLIFLLFNFSVNIVVWFIGYLVILCFQVISSEASQKHDIVHEQYNK